MAPAKLQTAFFALFSCASLSSAFVRPFRAHVTAGRAFPRLPALQRESESAIEELDDGKIGAGRDSEGALWIGPAGQQLRIFSGDYVVHPDFGIGKFLGLSKEREGTLIIEMSDANMELDILEAESLMRYRTGEDEDSGKRVALGSSVDARRWKKKLDKVAAKTERLAAEVVSLYVERSARQRIPCRIDGPKMQTFADAFEHTPTPDQLQCFNDVEIDMCWRPQPMDRLVCGDVGFGKTEVAMRAVYRAVLNGRQCAVLAPTTVLAAQHFRTMKQRMPDVNVVALHSRLRPAEAREVRASVENGTAQVVIGTHAILSGKTEFHNLKLLVIDEEQRFGVSHKERLKAVADGLDVLTLSATPIPRTLQMSLTGIRDMSTILTPPPERKEITTAVNIFNETLVQLVVNHEMKRGGQAIYVVSKIKDIEGVVDMLQRVVPKARLLVAHGRLSNLQDVVLDFSEGAADILIATTVVENGIDIPTVNSLIVHDAHNFGLSSLYQLRGRVGRRNVNGIALFMYPGKAQLTAPALRRLLALKELGLGSGFDLAHRDLEIRGAGSVVGKKQSGFITDVGYDLYCKMFTDAVENLRGSAIIPSPHCPSSVEGVTSVDREIDEAVSGVIGKDNFEALRLADSFKATREIGQDLLSGFREDEDAVEVVKEALKVAHVRIACQSLGAISLDEAADHDAVELSVPDLHPEMWKSWKAALGDEKVKAFTYVPAQSVETGTATEKGGARKVIVPPKLQVAGIMQQPPSERSEALLREILPVTKNVAKETADAMRRFHEINQQLLLEAERAEKEEKARKNAYGSARRRGRPSTVQSLPPIPKFPDMDNY